MPSTAASTRTSRTSATPAHTPKAIATHAPGAEGTTTNAAPETSAVPGARYGSAVARHTPFHPPRVRSEPDDASERAPPNPIARSGVQPGSHSNHPRGGQCQSRSLPQPAQVPSGHQAPSIRFFRSSSARGESRSSSRRLSISSRGRSFEEPVHQRLQRTSSRVRPGNNRPIDEGAAILSVGHVVLFSRECGAA